jgi:spore maturation protein B
MKIIALILPVCFILLFIYASVKHVKIYDTFALGAKEGLNTIFTIFPYLVTIFILTELFSASNLSNTLINFLSPFFNLLGIPKEIAPLVILKPFSGSGSLALLTEIFSLYGVDSYLSRCACAIFGSSETVFYISAVYYANVKEKRLLKPILISLFATFLSTIFACFICKFI